MEITVLCSALPRSEQPATAHGEDLRAVADRFPRFAPLLDQLGEEISDVARAVPSVPRHGDLWAGNILVRRGRLTGLVDWDAWHPAALPGVDLLHLVAINEKKRAGGGLGQTWLRKPWTSDRFRSLTADYWTSMRIVANDRLLRMVGVAWWANQVAATLHRLPHLADDARWVASNVDLVLEALAGPT
jgi:aminoglycoside phosphotransferase (APT) family kinase protein